MKAYSKCLAFITLAFLVSCRPPTEETLYNQYKLNDQAENTTEPELPTTSGPVKKAPGEEKPGKAGPGVDPSEKGPGKTPLPPSEKLASQCDLNIQVTSGIDSRVKILVGDREMLQERIEALESQNKISAKEKEFIIQARKGALNLQQGAELTDDEAGAQAAYQGVGVFKQTSAHGKEYLFYGDEGMIFDTTSSRSERLVIYAKEKLTVDATSFDVKNSLLFLESEDLELEVCLRETAAAELDIEIEAENSNVLVSSQGTSHRDMQIRSVISKSQIAKQVWKGTSFKGVDLHLEGHGSQSSETRLKFTSIEDGEAKVIQGGLQGSLAIEGTTIKNDPAKITIINQAMQGSEVTAKVYHTDAGGYQDFKSLLSQIGEELVID